MFDLTHRIYRSPDGDASAGDATADDALPALDGFEDGSGDAPAEPFTLSDDVPVVWEGLDKPLTGKEIREGYQRLSDYTRKTQELADQRKQYEQYQQHAQQWQQYARRLEAALQQRQQQAAGNGNASAAPIPNQGTMDQVLKKAREQGYIDADAFEQAIALDRADKAKYLQALALIAQQTWNANTQLQQLQQQRFVSSEEKAVTDAIKSAGVPEAATEFAQELAMDMLRSYVPDQQKGESWQDYLGQFPEMFKKRWQSLSKAMRDREKADLEQAKQQSRNIPGKGGAASPGKPVKPEMDVSKIAEMFNPD